MKVKLSPLTFILCLSFLLVLQSQNVHSQTDNVGEKEASLTNLIKVIDDDKSVKIIESDKTNKSPVGIWQWQNKSYWVVVNESGEFFQCSITKDDLIYKAFGKVIEGKFILNDIQFADSPKINIRDGLISIPDGNEQFSLVRVDRISENRCRSPFKKNEKSNAFSENATRRESDSQRGIKSEKGINSERGSGIGIGAENSQVESSPSNSKGLSRDIILLAKPQPRYTKEAGERGVQGNVLLRITFLANGKIGDVSAVTRLPYGLTERAIIAAKNIRFKPAIRNGQPITQVKRIQYTFIVSD